MPGLSVENLELSFGGIRALDQLSFEVAEGSLCALVGPNGAGKSSVFNCVTGLYRPSAGRVVFDGQDLLRLPAHAVAAAGVARTFQNLALFPRLTVLENVLLGGHLNQRSGPLACALHLPRHRRAERALRAEAGEVLELLGLASLADHLAAGLPYGTLKRVELARALMSRPRLLLLDEPAAGLPHGEVADLGDLIARIRTELGLSIVLVEHHMGMVMSISDKVVVLNLGRRICQGTPDEVSRDPDVIAAYLGEAA
ncbi:high-affinity branched-chain amino acid ABC transporter ATP-binding protein LivG [Actinomadura craniellae]|uniref:High-affinity branched-chain amino acid ABC transporter ATP-binding protein LivG n=1 Tax=Actinomadura craniellae TaxID=2231787 RepID=A0A365H000_9ACTN|nr:ABC transporter ATP-binding protein [Actinomadura craniellae]RAY12400.1 high-affinity branched-chain amino acid ABC transporter ATP-binding protein LivG [Actinomadura craniellae]